MLNESSGFNVVNQLIIKMLKTKKKKEIHIGSEKIVNTVFLKPR